ncbi:MAG: hypothetical protein NTY66_01075 [Candidatus Vogelbacteria bacterium]|nr:hypothetical protein [Candidatus Vogelbacteria bacterium]
MARFKFDREKQLMVGVEREAFLTNNEKITPRAEYVLEQRELKESKQEDQFGYELSACQIESRIGPCNLDRLHSQLRLVENTLVQALKEISRHDTGLGAAGADWLRDDPEGYVHANFGLRYTEVGPEDMPLNVYPNPRYLEIVKTMPRHILLAACRVIGTHVHIGMPDHETALRVYNAVIPYTDELVLQPIRASAGH